MPLDEANHGANKRLILASTSRYRRDLLSRLGLPFETVAPNTDETPRPKEPPTARAGRLAMEKARSAEAGDALVIGSDQVASLNGRILRKPGSHRAALEQLIACRNGIVEFATAAVVIDTAANRHWQTVDLTRVHFADHDTQSLDAYLRREQPYDCAGGFKAEGLGIALFTEIESTDPTALIGLPLIWISAMLRQAGFDPLAAASRE